MAQNPPKGSPRILPRLSYLDVGAAVEWLTRAFGFREREEARISGRDQAVTLTEMDVCDSRIMVGLAGNHDVDSPRSLGGRSGMLVVYVDDVDRHHERARAAGATIVVELADQFWGDRRYEALDLEGHRWAFHEHVRDVSREEMARSIRDLQPGS